MVPRGGKAEVGTGPPVGRDVAVVVGLVPVVLVAAGSCVIAAGAE